MAEMITDEAARTMRALWFAFLDAIEPARPKLHAYCLRLSGSIFDAEDLVQETLVRAFGAIGQGDVTGGASPLANARAYLSRIATNLWIDAQRRRTREWAATATLDDSRPSAETSVITPAAGAALFERTAPQERAAVVLKDVFDFNLDEIASILSTSAGAVKAALHRGRSKLAAASTEPGRTRGEPAAPELIDRFVAAFNARDLAALTALLSESVIYEARGVGGERGRKAIWIDVNIARPPEVAWERHKVDGEDVAVGVLTTRRGRRVLTGVSRLEQADGRISRHVGYFFCPETLAYVAERLGMAAANQGYHQDPETLARMIADSRLPWRDL
jgi:RNA polymerase sigma-70 factor (ECF subfamily)